jgi:uncharacterized protein (TIGR02145 family)
MNKTQGGDTVLYWPDTTLELENIQGDKLLFIGYASFHPVGIHEQDLNIQSFQVFQNYPNPVRDYTVVSMHIPEKGTVSIIVTDILGRNVNTTNCILDKGNHSFRYSPGNGKIFFITARWKGINRSIKVLNVGANSGYKHYLDYIGGDNRELHLKASSDKQNFVEESGIQDTAEINQTYTFQFATNISCPGTPTVTYEGQVYNTIQIFSQCWLQENLNAGVLIPSTQDQTDNDTIEKYCLMNNNYWCNLAGGLYLWDEMMSYANQTGGQGICPEGWHIPDDLDWQILEGAADSEYNIGDPEWDSYDWRGSDAGGNLKQTGTENWEPPNTGATDAFGFTAIPAGYIVQNGFWGAGYKTYFWSSNNAVKFYRNLDWNKAMIKRDSGDGPAFSVRCVKN